jgi:hypothetical protein
VGSCEHRDEYSGFWHHSLIVVVINVDGVR